MHKNHVTRLMSRIARLIYVFLHACERLPDPWSRCVLLTAYRHRLLLPAAPCLACNSTTVDVPTLGMQGEPAIVNVAWAALCVSFSASLAFVVWGRSGL